ncbi:MAG: ATP-dependent protease ATPase subunit HslU, partial [Clostridia bacterium]|nr:ATP-dependent protease ATPase subunit HslU [Clostridia bacterium]
LVKEEQMKIVASKATATAERKLVDILYDLKKGEKGEKPDELFRQEILNDLREGRFNDLHIEMTVQDAPKSMEILAGGGAEINLGSIFGDLMPKRTKKRKITVKEAMQHVINEESDKLIDLDAVNTEAVRRAEQEGIIFIDEIDKIAAKSKQGGVDVSREGVQRDILPIVEGSTVMTKYGPVKTDYILFIAAGAFHIAKVQDLIPELQGRFPIKVELKSLTKEDFVNILTMPQNAITLQYKTLLLVDNIDLKFTQDAIEEIAFIAAEMNASSEDIGARRLHTVMENLLEDISFNAGANIPLTTVVVDKKYVQEHFATEENNRNLKKYIL